MKNLKYNILVVLTFILPISTYVFVSSFVNNIEYNAYWEDAVVEDFEFGRNEFGNYIYNIKNQRAVYAEDVTAVNNVLYIQTQQKEYVLRIDKDYYVLHDKVLETQLRVAKLTPYDEFYAKNPDKESKVTFSVFIVIGIFTLGVLIVVGKISMDNIKRKFKSNVRESILISLTISIGVLFVLNLVLTNALYALLMLWISFVAYYIEYKVYHKDIIEEQSSETAKMLQEISKKIGG